MKDSERACRLFPVVSDIPSRDSSLASQGLGAPVQSLPQKDGDQALGSYARTAHKFSAH